MSSSVVKQFISRNPPRGSEEGSYRFPKARSRGGASPGVRENARTRVTAGTGMFALSDHRLIHCRSADREDSRGIRGKAVITMGDLEPRG